MERLIKPILLLALSFLSLATIAQQKEEATGMVVYLFQHQRDTASPSLYSEEMALLFGRSSSAYVSRSRQKNDSTVKAEIARQLESGGPIKLGRVSGDFTRQNYYHYFTKKSAAIESDFLSNVYVFTDTVPRIDWKIGADTRNIGGYTCQKATGLLAGRRYEAWFAPELAIPAGPWKLSGLPGLILEASDEKGEVRFLFQSIQRAPGRSIAVSPAAISTTRNDFRRMVTAYSENPEAFAAQTGLNIKVTQNPSSRPPEKLNNPIELPKPRP